jgi:hypothetical protein
MHRTTIFLTSRQRSKLADAAKPEGLSVASLIRIFINEGLARRSAQQAKLSGQNK